MQDILAILIVAVAAGVPGAPRLAALAARRRAARAARAQAAIGRLDQVAPLVTISPIMSHAKAQRREDSAIDLAFAPSRLCVRITAMAPRRIATDRARHHTFTASEKQPLRRRLLAWYAEHARDLPWRQSRDPYRVWVSEIMLQQTQVATVRDYFERFVARFPTSHALAAADERQVLRLWEGLGLLPPRAATARGGADRSSPNTAAEFPQRRRRAAEAARHRPLHGRRDRLDRLRPAGADSRSQHDPPVEPARSATATIHFDRPASACSGRWPTTSCRRSNVARFNQALMELGSLVCTPAEPRVRRMSARRACVRRTRPACSTKFHGRKPRQRVHRSARSGRRRPPQRPRAHAAMRRRRALGRPVGFSAIRSSKPKGRCSPATKSSPKSATQTGITCAPGPLVKTIKHGVTRYRITLDCYQAEYVSGQCARSLDRDRAADCR